jgi:hypothetical protein
MVVKEEKNVEEMRKIYLYIPPTSANTLEHAR